MKARSISTALLAGCFSLATVTFAMAQLSGVSAPTSGGVGSVGGLSAPTGSPSAIVGNPSADGTTSGFAYGSGGTAPGARNPGTAGGDRPNSADDVITREEHILDSQIKNICRGC